MSGTLHSTLRLAHAHLGRVRALYAGRSELATATRDYILINRITRSWTARVRGREISSLHMASMSDNWFHRDH